MQTNIENAAHSDLMLIDLGKTEKPTYVVAVLESVNESFFFPACKRISARA